MGTVVKKKDPVQLTQTDPVGYQDKLKEEEGGKKGPPQPTLALFPKERFLVQPSIEGMQQKQDKKEEEPEKLTEQDQDLVQLGENADSDFWLEEEGAGDSEEFKLETETDDIWEDTEKPEESPYLDTKVG